jgi:hypothetical protein
VEKWKPIRGWPGYEVSNRGRVKSTARQVDTFRNGAWYKRSIPERILKTSKANKLGHRRVDLQGDGLKKAALVHRLVAKAFIPNPEKLPNVLHGDDNPANNRVRNLRWGTHDDNMDDRAERERVSRGSGRPLAKLTEDDIPRIRRLLRQGHKMGDIGNRFGVSGAAIGFIKNGKTWTHIK